MKYITIFASTSSEAEEKFRSQLPEGYKLHNWFHDFGKEYTFWIKKRIKNKSLEKLFSRLDSESFESCEMLKKRKLLDTELNEICELLLDNQVSRGALFLLREVGDSNCVPALLFVIDKGYHDYEKSEAAEAVYEIMERNHNSLNASDLEKIAGLSDQVGSRSIQSDYSWDQGETTYEKVGMERLRQKAKEILIKRQKKN